MGSGSACTERTVTSRSCPSGATVNSAFIRCSQNGGNNYNLPSPQATNPNVFISYASDTKPLAEELTRALESQGIEPWVDFKDLQPGQRWREELERAIDAAQWFVIL